MKANDAPQVMRLVLDMMRLLGQGLHVERFGTRADELLLLAAVYVGQAEGRPMGASKLAQYAGLARPSVMRRLSEMQAHGLVVRIERGRYVVRDGVMDSASMRRAMQAAGKRVVAARRAD